MVKKLISLLLLLSTLGMWAQTNCNITVRTTPVSCHGGSDGKAEILVNGQLVVINGNGNNTGAGCYQGGAVQSPLTCSNAPSGAITISQTSGTVTMGGGNTYLITQAFNGTKFVFDGPATLVTCANVNLSGILEFNTTAPVQIYQTNTMTIGGANPVIPANVTFRSYTALAMTNGSNGSNTASIHGQMYNHASFQLVGNIYVSGYVHNDVPQAFPNNVEIAPGGTINNRGTFHAAAEMKVKGTLINSCEFSSTNLIMEGNIVNHGKIDVAWGSGTFFNSGTYQGHGNSYLRTNNFLMTANATAECLGSGCASVKCSTNTTIASGATFQGNLDFCQGNGTTLNNGSFINGATSNCSCVNATGVSNGGSGSQTGVNGTITWSSGTPILNGSTTTGLIAGTYSVTVNIENCNPVTLSYSITQPAAITASAALSNKIATVTASGGNAGGYTYVWSDGITSSSNVRDLTSAAAGTYCVTVRDSKGCESNAACVVITGPVIVTDPPYCDIIVQYTSTQVILNGGGTNCCEWSVTTPANPQGVTSITVNRPCEDSTITLKNCLGATSSLTITGRHDGCGTTVCTTPYCNACKNNCLSVTYTATPARCGQASLVELTVTGGIDNSYRTANSVNTQNGLIISGLPAGNHDITVFDITTQQFTVVTVTVPPTPQSNISLINASNPATSINTAVTLTTDNPDAGPYTISFSHFAPYYLTGVNAVNGSLGTYTIPANQGNGPFFVTVSDYYCNTITLPLYRSQVICENTSYEASFSVTAPVQAGGNNGAITITNLPLPSGVTATWMGTGFEGTRTGTTVNDLRAGTYTLLLQNTSEVPVCFIRTQTVVVPEGPSLVATTTLNECALTAQVQLLNAAGEPLTLPGLNYRWTNPYNGVIVSTSQNINLSTLSLEGNPGFLHLFVYDPYNRTASAVAAIPVTCNGTEPCNATLEYKLVNPSCANGNNGIIQIIATNGSHVTWLNQNLSNRWAWTQTGLSAGLYQVQVHKSGCAAPALFTIGLHNPAAMVITHEDFSPNSTTIVVEGGVSPYSYHWNDQEQPATSATRSGLQVGSTYRVIVTDAKGCSDTLQFVYNPCAISAPHPYAVYNEVDNTVVIQPGGGTGPFVDGDFYWVRQGNPQLNNPYGDYKSNLPNATYTITVTDRNGCSGSTTYNHPGCGAFKNDVIITTSNASSSAICDGTASITINNVSDYEDYTITWDEQNIQELLSKTDGLRALHEESSIRIINVCCGEHQVFVHRGGEEACAITRNFEVDCGTVDPPTCEESTLHIQVIGNTTVTRNCSNDPVNLNFTVTGGRMPYRYSWTYAAPGAEQPVSIPSDQPGYTNAIPGSYTVLVTDALGCTRQQSFTVNGPASTLSFTTSVTQANCANGTGSATVTPSGGSGSKTISWMNSSSTSFTRNDLAEGNTYVFTITDGAGCVTAGSVTINDIVITNSLSNATTSLCPDKTITLMARYLPGYSTVWSSTTSGVVISNPNVDLLTVSQTGTYVLTRQHLANPAGCPAHVETTVVVASSNCPTTQLCENFTYEFPPVVVEDVCTNHLTFAANTEALRKFDLYLEQVKRDFTNNFVNSTMNSLQESLTMSYTDKEQHYTLYYYDQAGNLTRTVPPAGVRALSNDQTEDINDYWKNLTDGNPATTAVKPEIVTQHTLASTYTYNSLNQLIAQDIPDHSQQDLWEQSQSLLLPSGQTVATLDNNGNKIWAFANSSDQAFLYTSNDAGAHYLGGLNLELGNILDIQKAGGSVETYYAVGTGGLILKATGGAASWSIVTGPTTTDLVKVHFNANADNGFIVDAAGTIWTTSNGGTSWASVNSSVTDGATSLGTLANALNGKTIFDIKIFNDKIFLTANDASKGYAYVAGDLTTFAFIRQTFKAPVLNKVFYDGTNTELFTGNLVFRKSTAASEFGFNRVISGITGEITNYIKNGTQYYAFTSSAVYTSTDGTNFTVINGVNPANLKISNGNIVVWSGTTLQRLTPTGLTTIFTSTVGNINSYAYEGGIEYILASNNIIVDITNNHTYNLTNVGIWWVTDLAVNGNVALVYGSGITPVRLTMNAGTPVMDKGTTLWNSGTIENVGGTLYLVSSNQYYAITVNNTSTPPQISIAGTAAFTPPANTRSFAFTTGISNYAVLDNNNVVSMVSGGSATVQTFAHGMVGTMTKGFDYQFYTCAAGGVIYRYNSTDNSLNYKYTGVTTNLGYASTSDPVNNPVLKVAGANNKLYRLTACDNPGNNATLEEEVATPVLTAPVKSISQDYLLTTDGKVYKGTTTSGVTTWAQEAGLSLTGFNVINGQNPTILAGGNNAAIRYNSGAGWLTPAGFKSAPVRDAAVSSDGTTLVAVGDQGTILVSTNGGTSFKPLKAPAATQLTSVTLYKTGFATANVNGAVYYYSSLTSAAYTTLATANSQTVRKMLPQGDKLWALRGTNVLYSATGAAFTTALTATNDLYDMTLSTDGYGFITGNNGTAYRVVPAGVVEEAESTTLTPVTLADGKQVKLIPTDNNITDDQGTGVPPSHLRSVRFSDRLTGHITGTGGIVLKTTDGGYHWKTEGSYTNANTPMLVFNGQEYGVYADGNTLGVIRDRAQSIGSRFWYDELGRLVLSQNAKQYNIQSYLNENQYTGIVVPGNSSTRVRAYSYTLYDDIGRITEVGELLTRDELTTYKHDSQVRYTDAESFVAAGEVHQITRTYYDRVAFPNLTQDFVQENLRPRVASVTYQDREGTTYDRATHYSYDIHGNVYTLLQEIHAAGETIMKRLDYDYDLISGNVHYVYFQKGEEDGFTHHYTYDGDNRIKEVFTSTDNITWNKEAGYDYYAHGPLARMKTGRDEVDQCDYAYTLQGWIKGVNAQNFSYALGYYTNDYSSIGANSLQATPMAKNLYNGNISTMTTHTPGFALAPVPMPTTFTQQYTYDQLNRISGSTVASQGNVHKTSYSYDANGNIETLQRWNKDGVQFDNLAYKYHKVDEGYLKNTNRLRWVDDVGPLANAHDADIEDQDRDNYGYDDIGNLIHDEKEEIERIEWNVYGKVDAVIRETNSTGKANLFFEYDASGNRVSKTSILNGMTSTTFYLRDATGNVMSVYKKEGVVASELEEQYIYGSSRLGAYKPGEDVSTELEIGITSGRHSVGRRNYEYSDHLGNVRVVFSDRKPGGMNHGIISATEYYPFGMALQSWGTYRYGFNGKELDQEGMGGTGNTYDYGFRIYNPQLAKFLSIDPLFGSYPWFTPYQFAGNRPIVAIDLDGLENVDTNDDCSGSDPNTEHSSEPENKPTLEQTTETGISTYEPGKDIQNYQIKDKVEKLETESANFEAGHPECIDCCRLFYQKALSILYDVPEENFDGNKKGTLESNFIESVAPNVSGPVKVEPIQMQGNKKVIVNSTNWSTYYKTQPGVSEELLSIANNSENKNGWFVFTVAPGMKYHITTVILDNTNADTPKFYYIDNHGMVSDLDAKGLNNIMYNNLNNAKIDYASQVKRDPKVKAKNPNPPLTTWIYILKQSPKN